MSKLALLLGVAKSKAPPAKSRGGGLAAALKGYSAGDEDSEPPEVEASENAEIDAVFDAFKADDKAAFRVALENAIHKCAAEMDGDDGAGDEMADEGDKALCASSRSRR